MLRFLTAGESHGPKLSVIIDGMPAGLLLESDTLSRELKKRQAGYGRSDRMRLENDQAQITAGVRRKRTTGAPIAVEIVNTIFENHIEIWSDSPPAPVTVPRPGHADLAGWAKYEGADIRDVIERASARETAARIVAGAVAKALLAEFDIRTGHKVRGIGDVKDESPFDWNPESRCCQGDPPTDDPDIAGRWKAIIDQARQRGDSVGGRFECRVRGLPMGLGSFAQFDRRLDGRIAGAMMAVPGVKAVAIGDGFIADQFEGSAFRDPIAGAAKDDRLPKRVSNHAGGLEGGLTNGEDLVVFGVMKPISGVSVPADSVDLETRRPTPSRHERADTCVAHAAAVICENVIAWEIAKAMTERYGGDTLQAMKAAFTRDAQGLAAWWKHE